VLNKWLLTNKESHLSLNLPNENDIDCLILDESTFIKNPKSDVSKFYTKHYKNIKYKIILSGTPAPESEMDYFQQIYFLDPDMLGYKDYWNYRQYACYQAGYDYLIKTEEKTKLLNTLSKQCSYLKRQDVSLGGEKIYERVTCSFNKDTKKAYDTLERDFMVETSTISIKTMFAGAKFSALRQLCGGFANGNLVSSHKTKTLFQLLNTSLKEQQVVIWAQFLNEIEWISRMLFAPVICGQVPQKERSSIREQFQKGKIRYIVAQPECWKYGVTLSAAETMIYYSAPCSALTRQQSEDRTLDIQKNNSCLIIDLVTKNTVEEDILFSLQKKENQDLLIRSIINNMKERLK
jgi:SNF2 family DNA or RNA helicase